MFLLIIGGSGSGKSEYAERRLAQLGEWELLQTAQGNKSRNSVAGQEAVSRYYVATMRPFGREGQERVERHRRQRDEYGFRTIERYTDLSGLVLGQASRADVLLECVSNLLANEMYEEQGSHEGAVQAILEGIDSLRRQSRHLVVVTNEVFSDGIAYEESTVDYMDRLGCINRELAQRADEVVEVVYLIPVLRKRAADTKAEESDNAFGEGI